MVILTILLVTIHRAIALCLRPLAAGAYGNSGEYYGMKGGYCQDFGYSIERVAYKGNASPMDSFYIRYIIRSRVGLYLTDT